MTSIIKVQNIQYTDGDAALTIADGGGVTTASTLNTTGSVGIKTTTPTNYYADDLVVTAPDEGGMTIVSGTTERTYLAFADGTSGDARYKGFVNYDHNTDMLALGSSGGTALEIDTNKYVTIPNQPSISVDGSRSSGNYFTTDGVGTYYTIKEWTTGTTGFYGSGVTYDGSNGRFTVPVAGKYLIGYSIYWYTNGVYAMISVHVNGSTRARHSQNFTSSGGGQDTCLSQSVMMDLAANDYIQLMIYQPSSAQHRYGMWHGHSNMHVHLIK